MRAFLIAFLEESEHRVVVSEAVLEEWNEHQSRYFRTWRQSMYARRRVDRIEADASSLRARVERRCPPDQRPAILKDVHLIAAALASDERVCSLDEALWRQLVVCLDALPDLGCILWVNPARDESAAKWLRDGAPDEMERRLAAGM